MAESTGVRIVEIRAGDSQRRVLELYPGAVVQPMSVGRVGMWSVDAPGVLDVHAYLYFDGRTLFVQSANDDDPARTHGKAIGASWQQVEIPCTIEIGHARLVYRAMERADTARNVPSDEEKTIARPIELPPSLQFAGDAGGFSSPLRDSDPTQLRPLKRDPEPPFPSPRELRPSGVPHSWSGAGGSPDSPPPSTRPPSQSIGYQAFGSVQVAVPAPPPPPPPSQPGPVAINEDGGPPGMQPPVPGPSQRDGLTQPVMYVGPGGPPYGRGLPRREPKGFAKTMAVWEAVPPIYKIIFFGTFACGVLLAYFILFFGRPLPRQSSPPAAASIASTTSSSPNLVTPSAMATESAAPSPIAIELGDTPTSTNSTPHDAKAKHSTERDAIALAQQGQYGKAADLYDQLAHEHPDHVAFREAARLLRLRASGN